MGKLKIHPVQILLVLLWTGLAAWFCRPKFITAGTILGVALCAVLIAVTLLFKPILRGISHLWSFTAGKIAISLAAAIIAAFVGICGYNAVMMSVYTHKPLNEIKCVMILGCQVMGTTPGYDLQARMETALPLIEQNPEVPVIVTGGKGRGEAITEAECARIWLEKCGVSPERIYMEQQSHSTETNFEFSKPIFDKLGIYDGIAVVTNDFHQYRAEIFAKRHGLSAGHYSSKTRLSYLPNYLIRELAAILKTQLSITPTSSV